MTTSFHTISISSFTNHPAIRRCTFGATDKVIKQAINTRMNIIPRNDSSKSPLSIYLWLYSPLLGHGRLSVS
jgi:hypothetical protein